MVSYAIANLEAQLGVTLFSREGTKKPRLTPAGEAVLEELRQVERGLESLRARVGVEHHPLPAGFPDPVGRERQVYRARIRPREIAHRIADHELVLVQRHGGVPVR